MLIRMNELHESWGRRVAERRRALDLTQDQLAELADVRQSTISRIESGACPRDEVKWRLAGALGVTVEALFPYPAIKPPFPAKAS